MSTLSILTQGIYNKLLTSRYNPVVSLEESIDIVQDMKDGRPRIEIELLQADTNQYVSQRGLYWVVNFGILGYLKKVNAIQDQRSHWNISDKVAILDFAVNTSALVFSLLDDKQSETFTCPGFEMFEGNSKIYPEFEIVPNISMFGLQINAVILQNDTVE
jgi:hypothetical protein